MDIESSYRLLGIRSDADLPEIKFAFRRLALVYHPDRNRSPEAEREFKAITEAYNTILRAQTMAPRVPVGRRKDVLAESAAKLTFMIFAGSSVVHSVSPKLFEQEVQKHFNRRSSPGTYCQIGKRYFEIDGGGRKGLNPLGWISNDHGALIEWYKTPSGTDKWKSVSWDDFRSYVRRYALRKDATRRR